jgi:hypothetical protein
MQTGSALGGKQRVLWFSGKVLAEVRYAWRGVSSHIFPTCRRLGLISIRALPYPALLMALLSSRGITDDVRTERICDREEKFCSINGIF